MPVGYSHGRPFGDITYDTFKKKIGLNVELQMTDWSSVGFRQISLRRNDQLLFLCRAAHDDASTRRAMWLL